MDILERPISTVNENVYLFSLDTAGECPRSSTHQVQEMVRPKREPQGVTIIDVARESHVSLATVSRVLNNSARVTRETRDAVLAVMAALAAVELKPLLVAAVDVVSPSFEVRVLLEQALVFKAAEKRQFLLIS